jgi:predicted O-methyltransferase YrrM
MNIDGSDGNGGGGGGGGNGGGGNGGGGDNYEHYKYSQTWFIHSEINKHLDNFFERTTANRILEIGCFEGLSSVFFADNFINHPSSTLTCVDPFLTIDNNDHGQFLLNNEELNFDYNLSVCKNSDKIAIHKVTSDAFFESINNKPYTYNMIYIDGCHESDVLMRDMENSFERLEPGGIMWMDDYEGGDRIRIKGVIDAFREKYANCCETIHRSYQLAIKKMN